MTNSGAATEGSDVLRLRVSLHGIKPTAWRRIVVSASITLCDLHIAIQAAMGWEDQHLWSFHLHGVDYGPEPGRAPGVPLSGFRLRNGERFSYVYDFGDWWDHDVRIEPLQQADLRCGVPRCIAGRGTCPPEDCGGPQGYATAVSEAFDPFGDDDFETMADFAEELADGLRTNDFSRIVMNQDRMDEMDRTVETMKRRLRLVEPFDRKTADKRIGGKQGADEGASP